MSGLIALKDQFKTMSPHKRLRYDGENLVKTTLSLAKSHGVSVRAQLAALDHTALDPLKGEGHKVFTPVRSDLLKEVSRLNDDKHWALTPEQTETFTTGILNIALEKQALDVEIYGALEKDSSSKDLKQANEEAVYELMQSPLGESIRSRDEQWAKKATEIYEGMHFALESLTMKSGVGDHGQALGLQQGQYKPESLENVKNVTQTYSHIESLAINQLQRADLDHRYFVSELRPNEAGAYVGNEYRSESFVIVTSGDKIGSWYSLENKTCGSNLADLLIAEKGLSVDESINALSHYSEMRESSDIMREYEESLMFERNREFERQELANEKLASVQRLVEKTEPLHGTIAETYLRKERGIQGELPGSLRYIPAGTAFSYNGEDKYIKNGSMASIATDQEGTVKAVQLTYLTEEGTRSLASDGSKSIKPTYGSIAGSFVDLTPPSEKENSSGPVILAEGVESALSFKESGIKGSVYAALGSNNLENLDVENREVIIAADWDGGYDKPSWDSTLTAQKALEEKGNDVTVVLPVKETELTKEKLDFNDLLKEGGVNSVIDRVSDRLPGVIRSVFSPGDFKEENDNERVSTLPSNQEVSHRDRNVPSAEHVHIQDQPLEKNHALPHGEKVETSVKDDPYDGLTVFEYMKKQMSEIPVQKKESIIKDDPYGGLSVFEYIKKEEAENPVQKKESVVKNDPYGGLSVFEYMKKVEAETPNQPKESLREKEKSAMEIFREAFNIKTPEKNQETAKSASSEKEKSRANDGWGMER